MRHFLLFVLLFSSSLFARAVHSPEAKILKDVVVQDGGRLKPLDTFARNLLLGVHGKSSIKPIEGGPKNSATSWLLDLMLNPETSYESLDFKIPLPAVIQALGLEVRKDHRYPFMKLRQGMASISQDLHKWFAKEPDDRTRTQRQVLELYHKMSKYYETSRSLTLFKKDLSIELEALAKDFSLEPGQKASYLYFHLQSDLLREEVTRISSVKEEERGERDQALLKFVADLSARINDQQVQTLFFIPTPPNVVDEVWRTPWALMGSHDIDEWTLERLKEWEAMVEAISMGRLDELEKVATNFKAAAAHRHNIEREVKFSESDPFTSSFICFLLGSLLLLVRWFWAAKRIDGSGAGAFMAKAVYWALLVSCVSGCLLQGYGIIQRMIIMNRPPVSTLYESVIFVSFVAIASCLVLEIFRRDGVGYLSAIIAGISLYFVGLSYADDGDTLGMLVAVLNSNFWLATHVVTITKGYGFTLVAGVMGHIWLVMAIWKPQNKSGLDGLYKNAIGMSLIALLLTTIGTILGGIWADQSWGRFWGWDPKENGAMLIVLWLLMLLHGRISGIMKAPSFAAGLVLANIVVALAWFGVNLLAVGLHSYGFTDSIAYTLLAFCSFETLFALVGYLWAKARLSSVP